jgi:hypothetical protein
MDDGWFWFLLNAVVIAGVLILTVASIAGWLGGKKGSPDE